MNFRTPFSKLKACFSLKKGSLLFFLYICATSVSFADLKIESKIDTAVLVLGDEARIQLKVDGTQRGVGLKFPSVKGLSFRQLGGPSASSQTVIINGRVQSFKGLIYQVGVTATQQGRFKIPPIQVQYDGKTYPAQRIDLKVIAAGQQRHMKVVTTASRKKVYVGQAVKVKLEWRLESSVEDYLFRFPLLNQKGELNLKLNPPDAAGKVVNLTVSGYKVPFAVKKEGGKSYTAYQSSFTLFPKKGGALTLPAASVKAQVQVGFEEKRDFFGDWVRVPKMENIFTTSNSTTIEVLPLPKKNRPPYFSGAVGRFKIETSTATPRVKVGDPIEVQIRIIGEGELGHVERPLLSELKAFKEGFTIVENLQPGDLKEDSITFTQTIRAQNTKTQKIPKLPFTFFNPERAQYQTVYSDPIKLKVLPARKVSSSDINIYTNREKSESIDLKHFKKGLQGNYLFENALQSQKPNPYWNLYLIIPPLLYIIMFSLFSYRKGVKEDKTHIKVKAAKGNMKKHLKNAHSLLSNETAEFFDELSSALTGYMSAKLDYGENAITALDINKLSLEHKIPDGLARKTAWLMEEFDRIRYTNMHCTSEDKEKLYQETHSILQKIERSL